MKELDESVNQLSITDSLMDDIQIIPNSQNSHVASQQPTTTLPGDVIGKDILRLSYPEHYKNRIGRDMRHLAVSIAASIDKPWQWKLFFDEGGGVLPLLECIRDGARSVEKGRADGDIEGTTTNSQLLLEQQQNEVSFAAACTACRALRDLSALSKDFAAVVTDDILRVNEQWSTCVVEGVGYDCYSGGLISDLLILLRHANEAESFYNGRGNNDRKGLHGSRRSSFSRTNRKGRQEARRRCGLYVVQLLLAMVVASDKAAATLRSTSGLIEAIEECSSYAPSERFKRKWIRKPINFIGRKLGLQKTPLRKDEWLKPGLQGQVQQNANKLLAGIGHNIWIPKLPGQKGLRILCLDGGGTRGIAAVTSIRHIVDAMKGVEVCDAFDMIVGTSTGAIVAFLVGLRRESAADARIRYDVLIKRIFVKSLLKPIMLATTTASYDEANLMEVLEEILKDDGMLDSRANPAVPLITAVSSKMSSTPSQLALLRNYNYGGGEMPDSFCIDPQKARKRLGLAYDDVMEPDQPSDLHKKSAIKCAPRTGKGSRYPGSFRVTQKIALRATTAAPTFFKPLLSFDELYVDGGILASNPTSVAVHEARSVYPDIPVELIVSVGTGRFEEIKVPPRVGWDGIVAQILDSATDAEQVHHAMEVRKSFQSRGKLFAILF
jgi:predicted acylesterase/phospholipase RssA